MKNVVAAAFAGAFMVAPAFATEITGGSVDIQYARANNDLNPSRFMAAASMEVGFDRSFGTQLDIAGYHFGAIGETGYTGTIHGIYHVNEYASIGAFVGRDKLASEGMTYFGIEAGFELDRFSSEIHYTRGDMYDVKGDIFGIDFAVGFNNNLTVGASIDMLDVAGAAGSDKLALELDYEVSPNTKLYGEIGTADASVLGFNLGSETFVGVGAKFNLGASRGSTFDRRGLVNFIPAF
jgi:hypothetical protein